MWPLTTGQTRNLPHGSELMYLPDRKPVLLNINTGLLETLRENPYEPGEVIFPVAAFNSPGYVITRISAYRETKSRKPCRCSHTGPLAGIKKAFDRPLSWWIPSRVRICGVCRAKM